MSYASACTLRACCVFAAAAVRPASRTANANLSLANQRYCTCVLEVPYALDCVQRFGGRVAAALLEELVMSSLSAVFAADAPKLQGAALHAVLAGVGQRARLVLQEGQGARSSNNQLNRGFAVKIRCELSSRSVSSAPRTLIILDRPNYCLSNFEATLRLRSCSNIQTSEAGWYARSTTRLL